MPLDDLPGQNFKANGIRLFLLGAPIVAFEGMDGSASPIAQGPLSLALLSYVALQPGQAASRERLSGLIWPEASPAQARANLRQIVFRLRRAGGGRGPTLLAEASTGIALHASVVRSDVAELKRLLANAGDTALVTVEALYRGPFLDGFALGRDLYDEWLGEARREVDALVLRALERLLHAELGEAERFRTIALAERLVGADPLREDRHRLLITALWRLEGRFSALRRAEELRATLMRETGAEMHDATRALIAEVRGGGQAPVRLPQAPAASRPSLAILPFRAIGEDPAASLLAEAIGEDVTVRLSRLPWLSVIASSAADKFWGVAPETAGAALGARYVLTGTVRAGAAGPRVIAELARAPTGVNAWAGRLDGDEAEPPRLGDDLADRLAAAAESGICAGEGRAALAASAATLDAWGLTMRALLLAGRLERRASEKAQAALKRAVSLAPDDALVHAMLGWVLYWHQLEFQVGNLAETFQAALRHARNAVRLDPREPWGHMVNGFLTSSTGDQSAAFDSLAEALRLNPNFPLALAMRGWVCVRAGESAAAVRDCERALRLSPDDVSVTLIKFAFGLALMADRQFERALAPLSEALASAPGFVDSLNILVVCCGHLGRRAEAERYLAQRYALLGWEWAIESASPRIRRFAHHDVFMEGLRKAGVPERPADPISRD